MSDSEQLEREERRGRMAQEILDNALFKESFHSVKTGILEAWANSPIRDHEGQHELRLMLKLLNDVEANLVDVMQTGKLAQITLREKRGLIDRLKDKFQ